MDPTSGLTDHSFDTRWPGPTGDRRKISLLVVGGTGESYPGDDRHTPTGLLAAVVEELDDRFMPRWVGYPASYGPAPVTYGMSFEASVAVGVRNLRAVLDAEVGPIALIGYSQGAVVIRTALRELEHAGGGELSRVVGVGLVADPHQPPGVVAGCDGWGVAGRGPELPSGVPVCWVGARDDLICNADDDSLVRDIADLTAAMSFADSATWARAMWVVLRRNTFQNARQTSLRPAQWARDVSRLVRAVRAVRAYLPTSVTVHRLQIPNRAGGRHTAYRAEPYRSGSVTDPTATGCDVIARWLQVQATFAAWAVPSESTR